MLHESKLYGLPGIKKFGLPNKIIMLFQISISLGFNYR
jgi:hypothetical protein